MGYLRAACSGFWLGGGAVEPEIFSWRWLPRIWGSIKIQCVRDFIYNVCAIVRPTVRGVTVVCLCVTPIALLCQHVSVSISARFSAGNSAPPCGRDG